MSELDGTQVTTLKRPVNDDEDAWKEYWESLGQHWRTELEIDEERQNYLTERRKAKPNIKQDIYPISAAGARRRKPGKIKPDIEQGIYPFKDIDPKLSRADIEWLLLTHENGSGPVDWNDESQRKREGR